MISTTTSVVLTGAIVAGTNLIDKKSISPKQLIGWGVYALAMAAFNEGNEKITAQFALIVLTGVLFTNMIKLAKGTGLSS